MAVASSYMRWPTRSNSASAPFRTRARNTITITARAPLRSVSIGPQWELRCLCTAGPLLVSLARRTLTAYATSGNSFASAPTVLRGPDCERVKPVARRQAGDDRGRPRRVRRAAAGHPARGQRALLGARRGAAHGADHRAPENPGHHRT